MSESTEAVVEIPCPFCGLPRETIGPRHPMSGQPMCCEDARAAWTDAERFPDQATNTESNPS